MSSSVFFIALISAACFSTATAEMPAFKTIFKFFSYGGASDYNGNGTRTKDISQMTLEELGISRGQCQYDFLPYITYSERLYCAPDDHHILHLLPSNITEAVRKPPIMMRCLQPERHENATRNDNTLLIMQNLKDIVALLKPVGNATKRHEPGSCVIVLFYTESSLGCAHVAPYANMLPILFPTLRFAAIDAFKFPSFNTEFGIVGLPTLLLFHQGRPIVKFYSDIGTFHAFVTRHTGIKPIEPIPKDLEVTGPLPLQPVPQVDYVLILAWAFILLCVGNYFAKSQLCKQIVEMIKRNWRESEARMERN
ncbi:thioredoxin domain-containing protein 15 [Bactrocera neohumeralis]|uniref:thioredoxin domain-containing protein 15 n=1 Tax=Bactrocera neohumeralis TaxID=98809 RepID=UPI0021656AC5|nr:thioredoxin domain-containing protein 15 [Bactrocera neohumeralis]